MKHSVFENQHVLVIGMARSGIDAARLLHYQGARVSLYDSKPQGSIKDLERLDTIPYRGYFGGDLPSLEGVDLCVLSPGVPLEIDLILMAKEKGIPYLSEVELAYRCAEGTFIGITGTNGKTTTTALIGEMFKADRKKTHVVGNIGIPVSSAVLESDDAQTFYITELSSYQLETVDQFKVAVGVLLNITPDHLARHKTMEAYVDAKLNMIRHLASHTDFILNFDQDYTQGLRTRFPLASGFSKHKLDALAHIETIDEVPWLVVGETGRVQPVIPTSQIKLIGDHNLENALAAVAVAFKAGVSLPAMAQALSSFSGYAHRIEFVAKIDGITYYNDSKATNPEASIPAIRAMAVPTVLIAGGMDKGNDYAPWIETFKNIKHVVLLGETKEAIAARMEQLTDVPFTLVETLEEALVTAKKYARSGDNILLSPACASWDMFESFEVRGDLFKRLVVTK